MMMLHPLMEAVRNGGDLGKAGGSDMYVKDIVCPDRKVAFREESVHIQGIPVISGMKIILLH